MILGPLANSDRQNRDLNREIILRLTNRSIRVAGYPVQGADSYDWSAKIEPIT